jgi:biopolymer transport protein ExbD
MRSALHVSPLIDVLAVVAMMSLVPLELARPSRGLRTTYPSMGCVAWGEPADVTLHLTVRGVHWLEGRGPTPRFDTPRAALEPLRAERPAARRLRVFVDDAVDLQQVIGLVDAAVVLGFDDVRLLPR